MIGDVLHLLLVEEQQDTEHDLRDHHQRHDRAENAEKAGRLSNGAAASEERQHEDEGAQGGYSVGEAVEGILVEELFVIELYYFGEYADAQVD